MPTGYSLHIGLNYVDRNNYEGWDGKLNCCINDAEAMLKIATKENFAHSVSLHNEQATRKNVSNTLKDFASRMESNDILFMSYSGHGGSVLDENGDEPDLSDETYCLYDGDFLDDEMHLLFSEFKNDVRILVIADCCHSGSITKNGKENITYKSLENDLISEGCMPRMRPKGIGKIIQLKKDKFYTQFRNHPIVDLSEIGANVLLLSACKDDQKAFEFKQHGLLTKRIIACWDDGNFDSNYDKLHKEIIEKMPKAQTPQLYLTGEADKSFLKQKPFSIDTNKTESYVPRLFRFLSEHF